MSFFRSAKIINQQILRNLSSRSFHKNIGNVNSKMMLRSLIAGWGLITAGVLASDDANVEARKSARAKRSYDYMFKVVLVGSRDVGKTAMLLRFADEHWRAPQYGTIGVDFRFKEIKVGDKTAKLQIWDTAGQERFRTITSAYYRGADAIMLVYDVTEKDTFDTLQDWNREIMRYAPETTLRMLIGHKSDRVHNRKISFDTGKAYADELNIPFVEASAKSGENIDKAFGSIAVKLVQNLERPPRIMAGQVLDASALAVVFGVDWFKKFMIYEREGTFMVLTPCMDLEPCVQGSLTSSKRISQRNLLSLDKSVVRNIFLMLQPANRIYPEELPHYMKLVWKERIERSGRPMKKKRFSLFSNMLKSSASKK